MIGPGWEDIPMPEDYWHEIEEEYNPENEWEADDEMSEM